MRRALDRSRLVLENQRYRDKLEAANRELEASLHLLQEDQTAGRQVQMNMLPESPWAAGEFAFEHQIIRRCTCRVISSTTSASMTGVSPSTLPMFPGMARRRPLSPCC